MYKTVFYDEDENIRLTRYWSSKDGNLILEIQSAGADEYPGPEGNIQLDARTWFTYNVFDRNGRIKVSYVADEPDDRYPDAYWNVERNLDALHVFYGKRPKFLQRYWDEKKTGANKYYDDKRLQQFIEIDAADYDGPIDVSRHGCRKIECDDAFKTKLLKFDRLVYYIKKVFLDPSSTYYQQPPAPENGK